MPAGGDGGFVKRFLAEFCAVQGQENDLADARSQKENTTDEESCLGPIEGIEDHGGDQASHGNAHGNERLNFIAGLDLVQQILQALFAFLFCLGRGDGIEK